MENVIIVLILLAIVIGIIVYLVRAKRRGQTCIGCPYAKKCGGKCGGMQQRPAIIIIINKNIVAKFQKCYIRFKRNIVVNIQYLVR